MDINYPTYEADDFDPGLYPELKACLDIWNEKRGDRFAPSWDQLGFLAFPPDLIARMILVDIIPEPLDFRYRFFGTVFCDLEGYDLTGKSVDDYQPPKAAKLTRERFEAFYRDPKPTFYVMSNGEEKNSGKEFSIYIGLRLPLSNDGQTMNQFLGVAQLGNDKKVIKEYFDSLVTQSTGANDMIRRSTSNF